MKKILVIIAMLFSTIAFADNTATSGAQSGQEQQSSVRNDSHDVVNGSDVSRSVGVAVAPALATTLTETCMGSTSAGAGWSGASISFGTTWRDSACVRRLDARQMSALGEIPVAVEMMCDSDLVREAAVRAGRPCVADGGQPRGLPVVAAAPQIQEVPTLEAASPVVREEVRE